jgi:predicted enzyme related to lactoylglutathione lyase
MPAHAVFYIAVTDVAATCETVEQLGGKIESKELAPAAGPPFAYVRDPVGSLFGVFTPPA